MAEVRFEYNPGKWRRELIAPSGPVERDLHRRVQNVVNEAKRLAPVYKGVLRSSITGVVERDGDGLVGRVGSNLRYAIFVHEGTGVYGPRRRPIRPRQARRLVFQNRAGRTVFARQVSGVPARPFLRDALPAAAR
jgi:hypothetical protein